MINQWNKWNKYLTVKKYDNLPRMLQDSINRFGNKFVMRWFSEDLSEVHTLTYNELGDRMHWVWGGLYELGFRKNDMIAICSETRAEWIMADFGILSNGAITVAVYPSLKPSEIKYIVNDSGSKGIFVGDEENLKKVLSIEAECPTLKHIIVIDEFEPSLKKENVHSFHEIMERGKNFYESNKDLFEQCVSAINEEDLASLIYTSGTTGIPKGTMLTHRNFLSDATAAIAIASTLKRHQKPYEMDFLTVMPFSHSFARCVDEYCALYIGASINFTGGYDPKRIRKAFETFRPTMMVGIPYLYQKIYQMILDEVDHLPPKMKKIFQTAVSSGREYWINKRDRKKNSFKTVLKYKIIGGLVSKIIKKKLGGRLLLMISGSAKINYDLVIFFYSNNLILVEGYGLTETSPVTHLMRTEFNSDFRPNFKKKIPHYVKLGSIGPPIEFIGNPYPNVEQKVDEFGELMIRGPMVMKGYWNKKQQTDECIDKDGWFRTGDLAEIDEDGYAKIKGRAKVIIKLLTGKMISPIIIENMVVPTSKVVAQLILVGDDTRKYITCIVVPYQKELREYADKNNIPYKTWSDLLHNRQILERIKTEIISLTNEVSEYQIPKKFAISSASFDAKDGYLTPSFKFKREKVFADLKEDIDKMYAQDDEFYIIESRMTDWYDQSKIIS